MASNLNFNDNGLRASKLLVDGGGYLTKQILLQHAISGTINSLDEFLAEQNVKRTIQKLKFRKLIPKTYYAVIYPSNGTPTNLDEWDITLVTLILNNCLQISPAEYIAILDIRDLRNTLYGHTAKVGMTDTEFQQNWTKISSTLMKHVKLLTDPNSIMFIQGMITTVLTETLSADKTIDTLKQWYEWGLNVEQKLEELANEQTMRFEESEIKSYRRHHETQDKLLDIQTSQRKAPDDLILKLHQYYKEQYVDKTQLNRRIRQANNVLEVHHKDLKKYGFQHKTRMTEEFTTKLKKNKILVLKGVQGSGKTHLAKNVLVNFLSLNPDISPLIIRTPNEIDKVLDPTGSFVLLVDDLIGTNSFDAIEYKDWCQYIETLVSQVAVGTLFVVITIRTSIYRQCQSGKLSKLFEEANVLDESVYLLEGEKETIFKSFVKYHDVNISSERTKLIIQQKSVGIGFPLLCRMMKGQDVDKLFQSPTKYLKTEMLRIKEDIPVCFVLLFMTLVGDGMLSKTSPTENQISCFETLQNFFKTSPMDLNLIFQTAKSFEETFFNFNDTEFNFSFIHETIAQSIFEAALEFIPHILIQYCPFDTLIRNLNLIGETPTSKEKKPNPYFVHKQHIIERMRSVMSSNESTSNIKSVASASLWNNTDFADEAFRKFELIYFYQEDDKGVSMLSHFASLGFKYLLENIVSRSTHVDKKDLIFNQIHKALDQSCLADKKDCADYLISKVKEMRPESVFAAVKGGNIEIVKRIVSHFGIGKIDTLKQETTENTVLHIAAESGRIEIVKYLYQLCPTLLHGKDTNGWNVAHSSAKSGKTECLKYVLQKGTDGNQLTYAGETLLHIATKGGHINTVHYIQETYTNLMNLKDFKECNVAHSAALGGNIECFRFLIDIGVDPKQKASNGTTILHIAAAAGNLNLLVYLCQRYEELVQKTDKDGFNLIHYAAISSLECMQYVIKKYKNVLHLIHEQGNTILHISALNGNMNTVKYICETYPDLVHLTDNGGRNALHKTAHQGTVECMIYLVKHGLNPRDKTGDGDTILHQAALGGNIDTLTYICETYPDMLKVTDNDGRNVLHNAANQGTVKCMIYLVKHGLNPRDKTGDGHTILHRAALQGNINTLTYICETYPDMLQVTDNDGTNALHQAAHKGTVECMKYLVKHGLNPRDKTGDGYTILHRAALGGNISTLTYICEIYPDLLHLTDNAGRNALHNTAHKGTVECLKYLVDHELNPRDKTGEGETILHRATLGGNINTLTYICETYPDMLQVTDNDGRNVLHNAANQGTVKCMIYLVKHGLNPRDKTGDGDTILHRAALQGNINTLTYICETYPDMLQVTDNDGTNALHKAAHKGTVKCMIYLVKHGLNPRDKTGDGDTILHQAALGGNINKLTYICETYPDLVHLTDNRGRNALYYAAHQGTFECLKYLVDHELNPRDKTGDGDTILHQAALGGNINTLTYICETYPDMLQVTDNDGTNALHKAAHKGTVECMIYLVKHGLNPRDKTGEGETILHQAALCGNINAMTYICETYPDMLQVTDNDGGSALHNAAHQGTVKCMIYLVKHGLNPRDKTGDGGTILHQAALGGNINTMTYICETYPDMLQVTDNDGGSALHNAAHQGTVKCMIYLVKHGLNRRDKTGDGHTILHRAALGGNINTMTYIYETYPDLVELTNNGGRNALHMAAHQGTVKCMIYLVKHGLNPRDKTGDGDTILHQAALGGNINKLTYICETYPDLVHLTDNRGRNALYYAAHQGTFECLKYLVDHELNPRDKTGDGDTILHQAALGGNINTLTYICETYPDMLQVTDNDGTNALHKAAHKGTVECMIYLVKHGLNPRDKTGDGGTILHQAALGGNINTMTYICETYPDMLQVTDNDGGSALHNAAHQGTVKCMIYLVKHELNRRDKTGDGHTILHRAALGGNINTMTYICETYPDLVELTNNGGRNALHMAAHQGTVKCMIYLVKHGLNPRDKTGDGDTILHRAALGGNINTLTYICETYPEMLQVTDNDGRNALHNAANKGTVECMIYLVKHGLNPRDKTGDGDTILHQAALGGNINTMTYICETYPDLVELTDNGDRNVLHNAAHKGTVGCLKYLVDHGLNPRDKTGEGETILHRAALGGNISTLTYICETYPDLVHLTDNAGRNALHKAAHQGTVKCMKYLVKHGLNPRDKTGDGDTILHQAALEGNINTLMYICETYPDLVHLTDNRGRNALHKAAHQRTVKCMIYLVDHGLNPRDKTGDGGTLLHEAASGGNINTMTYICETYPDMLQVTDNDGRNALHKAAHQGTVKCMIYLVKHGLNPRDKTGKGETILHRAALGGNMNTMTYTCETYPDMLQVTDNGGRNALHYAAHQGTVKCMIYLVKHGLNPRVKTGDGDTILHGAALGGNMNTMTYTCETYPDLVQVTDNDGSNALHKTAHQGSVECMIYLVKHGLNPRDKTGKGQTILHRTALAGNIKAMTYICETYPDMLQVTDNDGRNALHYAAHQGTVKCMIYLVKHGLNPRDKTGDGDTILHGAALGGNMNTMTYTCETYPDLVQVTDNDGSNALHKTAHQGSVECMIYLVKHGLNPRDKTGKGQTILHRAALAGNIKAMTYICETYPDMLQVTDNDGRNALHYAAHQGTVKCMIYLVEHGLNPRDKQEMDTPYYIERH